MYAAVSYPIDFGAWSHDVWLYLVLKAAGAAVGVSVVSEDGSAILTDEVEIKPGPHLRPALIRVTPAAGRGLILLRNYDAEGQAGAAEVDSLEVLEADDPWAKRLAAVHPIFRPDWYEPQRPETDFSRQDPLAHFLKVGAAEGADPNPHFHSLWYAQTYPDAAASGLTPIEFYLATGGLRGDDPAPHFKGAWYLEEDPTLLASGETPLANYLKWGKILLRVPNATDDHFLLDDLGREGDIVTPEVWAAQLQADQSDTPTSPVIFDLREAYSHAVGHNEVLWPSASPYPPQNPDRAPIPYVAAFNDVLATGGGSLIITKAGEALHDELYLSDRHASSDTKTDALDRLPGHRLLLRPSNRQVVGLASGIHLMNEADANYFHWVAEVLPRLFLMQEQGVIDALPADMPLLISEGLDPNLLEMLSYVATQARDRVQLKRDQLYRIDRLVYPGALTRVLNNYYQPLGPRNTSLPVEVLSRMAQAVKARIQPAQPPNRRRVYLRRGGLRSMVNQRALEEALIDEGFEILNIVGLSARAQVQLFAQCEQIVGASGAAVTNILWCEPGTRVTVLYPDHRASNTGIWAALAEAAGCSIDHIRCPRTYNQIGRFGVHDDYSFPMDQLPRLL